MGGSVVNCLFNIINLCVLKGYTTSPTLTLDGTDVFVDSNITLTCSTFSTPDRVIWFKTEKGSVVEEKVIAQLWQNKTQACRTDNNTMECHCSSSKVYSCSIKSVKATHDGQSWRCKASDGKVQIESNVFTLRLILPITSLTILPQTSVAFPVFNEVSNFTCITSLSRPTASIQWFNDNINLTSLAIHSHNYSVARSDLQYIPNSNWYSGGNISCVAYYDFKSISKVLTANMSIQVQFPVSKPIVTINNVSISTEFPIKEGRLVHLNCSSSGYPQPSYIWTFPGGSSNGTLLNCAFTRNNGSVSCKAYNVMHKLDGTPSAQATYYITELKINVLYPPVITKLSSNDKSVDIIDSTIRIQRGDNINIVCTSDANPPAMVFWHGQLIKSPALTVTSVQHDAIWTCQATNVMTEFDGAKSTSTVAINVSARVLYGPDVPTITYTILPNVDESRNAFHDPIKVIEGSSIILKCSVHSVPNSTYSWNPGDERSIQTIVNITRTTKTRYNCTANTIMNTSFKGNVTGSNYSSASLDILYGPANIVVKYNNIKTLQHEFKVIAGWSFTLLCLARSNPSPRYSWFGLVAHEGDVLTIRNVRTDMNRSVTCKAENNMVDSGGKSVIGTEYLTVSMEVLYSPAVHHLQNQTVLLNTSLTVVCNFTDVGNPPASNISWIRTDTNKVVGTGKTLTISSIKVADEGEYQCYASNSMQPIGNAVLFGSNGAYIRVFEANQLHNSIIVNQGETVELLCDADGDPKPFVRVINTSRGNDSTLVEIEGREAKYRIQQAHCEYDTGNYTCSASNRYNERREFLAIFINCSPRTSPFSPPITTLYRAPNDTVLFTFTIIAYPKPILQDIVWYKRDDDRWRVLSHDISSVVTTSDNSMQIQLKISYVQLEDYTDYMVNVSNNWGWTAKVFTLKAQSKPNVPTELQVSRTGKTELIFEWIPGFNGGESQTFIIRYKSLGDESWIEIPINSSNYVWTIDGLKSGTTYQIQMMAHNKIGKSDWTQEINITTLFDTVIVDKGPTSSAIWGSIGGAAGVVIIVAVLVVIWKHRTRGLITKKHCRTKRTSLTKYEDLIRGQGNNDA